MDIRPQRRIVIPLDVPDLEQASGLVAKLYQHVGVFKVGLQLFISSGSTAVDMARDAGNKVFLDLKLHDIPNTVARAVESAAALGADYLTVHATGGRKMLAEAVKAAPPSTTLLAVTMLTSLSEDDLANDLQVRHVAPDPSSKILTMSQSQHYVLNMARMAYESGIRGFVCSPKEVGMLRNELGPDVVLVVPGIRPAEADKNDQERVATPEEAVKDGATLLVVGRPITAAKDPVMEAVKIAESIRPHTTGRY